MTDRRVAETVGAKVSAAISAADVSVASVAEATDLTISQLNERLLGDRPFTVRELAQVGGFVHFPPSHFLQGASA